MSLISAGGIEEPYSSTAGALWPEPRRYGAVMPGAWRFADPPATGVFSTRQVFVEGAFLALVSHDGDGDWQFLHDGDEEGDEDLRSEDDLLLVRLQEVVDRFPEVVVLSDLPRGWYAWRDGPEVPWTRERQPADWSAD
jgi:hypothetical protein